MTQQFTASEVRELAKHMESVGWRPDSKGDPECYDEGAARSAEMLDAFADLLEAREKAVPVAWRTFDGEGNYDYRDYENNEHYRDWYVSRNGAKYANWVEPLYTHPSPSDAERLEELGRILRGAMIQGDARVIGKNELKHALEILAAHPAQAQPPAASVTDAMVQRAFDKLLADGLDDLDRPKIEGMRAALESALAAQEKPNG